jgi:hypothetical protein
VEESEGGGDIQGDGDRTLGDADSSCCEDENRAAEVKGNVRKSFLPLRVFIFFFWLF